MLQYIRNNILEKIMSIKNWLKENTSSLSGKTIAITGSTGGIGQELCKYIAGLGGNLILVDRNRDKSEDHMKALHAQFPGTTVSCISANLENTASVKRAVESLKKENIDIFIHKF